GEVRRILRPTGTLWVSGTHHAIFAVGFAMQQLGFHLLNTVVWSKPNAPPNLACRFFTHSSELIVWASPFRASPLAHAFNYAEMTRRNGGRQMRDVWSIPTTPRREKRFGGHPTQKPEALLERIVEASSRAGDVVLDPFNGSGTTGVVAIRNGRRYVGID